MRVGVSTVELVGAREVGREQRSVVVLIGLGLGVGVGVGLGLGLGLTSGLGGLELRLGVGLTWCSPIRPVLPGPRLTSMYSSGCLRSCRLSVWKLKGRMEVLPAAEVLAARAW